MAGLFSKILSIGSDKELREYNAIADEVARLGDRFAKMDDEELSGQTVLFRERLEKGETLDDLLPEAFACAREASDRVLGMRHFDVQVVGGIALHRGTIAEMKTGEGKTLVSTLAGYLNALPGKGVHIVTVNDYLARRDSEWMGQLYNFLGLEVGLLQNGMPLADKAPAYAADVTYGTNSEFGFDYLRDNMVTRASMRVQRGQNFAIVDEVDSILIDEARTPLIISGAGTKSADTYKDFARAVRGLVRAEEPERDPLGGPVPEPDGDYIMDEAKHTIAATEQGLRKIEERLGADIYSDLSGQLANHLQQALKAQYMFHRDKDYAVLDGEVKIVDEFTGRIMEGRRWSEGLHQAVEAKEGVLVREENQTLATITLQNYFRLYDKLSGMTGTAMTEDAEFREIYKLPVTEIPPNKPVTRVDHDDRIYRNVDYKFQAVAADVEERHAKGQPVLVGTVSIESSERLSKMLTQRGIKHEVLNAKFHEREAQIVAQAGREGAVTIATNMAGRGTDILLGGNPVELASQLLAEEGLTEDSATPEQLADANKRAKESCAEERERVLAAGGLAVIGTERHESRRIDNQLRGRSGRQGDPGESRFYISLEDDLMRLFGSEKLMGIFKSLGVPENEQIEHKMLSSAIEKAQKKIEGNNYGIRKNLLDYDQVNNEQREIIYKERRRVLDGESMRDTIFKMIADTIDNTVDLCIGENTEQSEWDLNELNEMLLSIMPVKAVTKERVEKISKNELKQQLKEEAVKLYEEKEAEFPEEEQIRELERVVLLKVIDQKWMDHIDDMDQLREGIGLQAYGQRDPKVEYKMAAYDMFNEMLESIQQDTVRLLFHVRVEQKVEREQVAKVTGTNKDESGPRKPVQRAERKIYPNDPCPCGSGKKYKQCCGRKPV